MMIKKTLTIVPWKGFWAFGLFCDHNFPTLFYGNPIPFFMCLYQKIIQVKLTSINIKFAYHVTNIYFKIIKILIHFILYFTWVHVQKNNYMVEFSHIVMFQIT
jgi:hypothetical protein